MARNATGSMSRTTGKNVNPSRYFSKFCLENLMRSWRFRRGVRGINNGKV